MEDKRLIDDELILSNRKTLSDKGLQALRMAGVAAVVLLLFEGWGLWDGIENIYSWIFQLFFYWGDLTWGDIFFYVVIIFLLILMSVAELAGIFFLGKFIVACREKSKEGTLGRALLHIRNYLFAIFTTIVLSILSIVLPDFFMGYWMPLQ